MNISIKRFGDDLKESIEWLRSLGFRVDPTRFGQYERLYRTLEGSSTEEPLSSDEFALALAGLECGQELSEIRRFLQHLSIDELKLRLRIYLEGPPVEADEKSQTSSNNARNTGFELVFAARLAKAGYTPVFPPDGDLAVRSEESNLNIECKRPQSLRNLRSLIKDASNQLRDRANVPGEERAVRLIALSIGKVIHAGSNILEVPTADMIGECVFGHIARFRERHDHMWQTWDGNTAHAVLMELSAVVHVISPNYWLWAQFDAINPVDRNRNGDANVELSRLAYALECASHLTLI